MRFRPVVSFLAVLGSAVAAHAASSSYGTTATSYYTVGSAEFAPSSNTVAYTVTYRLEGTSGTYSAYAHLPSGALVTSIEWRFAGLAQDSLAPAMTAVLLDLYGSEILSNTVPAGVIVPQKGSATVTQPLTGGNWTVDNHGSQLYLGVIATDAFSFLGATVSFRLQVSPATYPPTFGDVPTYDVGYQYIEALAVRNYRRLRKRQLLSRRGGHTPSNGGVSREGARTSVALIWSF